MEFSENDATKPQEDFAAPAGHHRTELLLGVGVVRSHVDVVDSEIERLVHQPLRFRAIFCTRGSQPGRQDEPRQTAQHAFTASAAKSCSNLRRHV